MTAILQVLGDPKGYKSARFVIDGKEYRQRFLALAIREWLKEGEIIFLVPDSLVTRIERDMEEALKLLKDRKKFRKRISELLEVDADLLIIPSVGTYTGDYTARFEGSIENTIVFVFKELVKRGFNDIYADISTGLNIFTTAMIEALRKYLTYKKLKRILQGGDKITSKLVFVPQILVENQAVKVELHDFDVQAFFSLPDASPKEICADIDTKIGISRKYDKFFKEITGHIRTLRMAFNGIKYNTPLVFYHPGIIDLDIDAEKIEREFMKIIDELEDLKEIFVSDRTITVRRPVIVSGNVVNTFFAISMLSSIIDFWKSLSEPEIDSILKTFKSLYENLGLEVNSRFLERDIETIKELAENLKGEKLLLELYPSSGKSKSKDKKRNFFAHSGFLREITLVKKECDRITLRYLPESTKEIRSWLDDPK